MKSDKPTSVDEYISGFPKETQVLLSKMRSAIRKAAPKAEEMISYNMPLYKMDGVMLISFAGWKDHIGLYPSPVQVTKDFKTKLAPYEGAKATLKFPNDQALPLELITQCVKFRIKESLNRGKTKPK